MVLNAILSCLIASWCFVVVFPRCGPSWCRSSDSAGDWLRPIQPETTTSLWWFPLISIRLLNCFKGFCFRIRDFLQTPLFQKIHQDPKEDFVYSVYPCCSRLREKSLQAGTVYSWMKQGFGVFYSLLLIQIVAHPKGHYSNDLTK